MIFSNFYKIISTAKVLNIIYFRLPIPPKQLLTAYFLTNVKKTDNFYFFSNLEKKKYAATKKMIITIRTAISWPPIPQFILFIPFV
jgi:hypothetical protein